MEEVVEVSAEAAVSVVVDCMQLDEVSSCRREISTTIAIKHAALISDMPSEKGRDRDREKEDLNEHAKWQLSNRKRRRRKRCFLSIQCKKCGSATTAKGNTTQPANRDPKQTSVQVADGLAKLRDAIWCLF